MNDLEIIGFDNSKTGINTITIRYFDLITTFDVTIVKEPDPTDPISLEITKQPEKREYTRFSSEELDLTGIELTATLANGETEIVSLDDVRIAGFDLTSDEEIQFISIVYKEVSTALIISIVENEELFIGDVDNDGKLSAGDARLTLRYTVGLEPNLTSYQINVADYNRDGSVTSSDARSILRVSVGLTP